jgi:hypothetical protein
MAMPTPEEINFYMKNADDNLKPNLIATIVTCIVLPFIAVVLRLIGRRFLRAPLLADDWLIIFSLIPMLGMHISTAVAVSVGMGKHVIFVTSLPVFAKSIISIEVFYAVTVITTKFSILAFYHRIFTSRSLAILSILIAILVLMYNLALVLVVFLQCTPLRRLWTPTVSGTCISTSAAFTTLAIANVVTDVAILALPIKEVWALHMTTTRKVQVVGIFALGGIVCVFGIIRTLVVGLASIRDASYTNAKGGIWSQAEISVGIICACLPTFRPLFSKSARHTQPSYGSYTGKRSDHSKGSKFSNLDSGTGGVRSDPDSILLKSVGKDGMVWSSVSGRKSTSNESDEQPFAGSEGQFGSDIRVDSQIHQTWKNTSENRK